jgi:endo-1,4-beta-xylanase
VARAGDGSVTVSWTAPAIDGGRPITASIVVPAPAAPSASIAITGTTAAVTGLVNGTSYTFQVFARSAWA